MGSAAMSVVPLSDRRDEESCLKHSDPYQPVVPERNPALNLIGTIAQPPKWEHAPAVPPCGGALVHGHDVRGEEAWLGRDRGWARVE